MAADTDIKRRDRDRSTTSSASPSAGNRGSPAGTREPRQRAVHDGGLRGGRPIGMARVLGDGGYILYIADVIVLPEHQGPASGYMMEQVMASSGTIPDWVRPCS